MTTTRTRFDNGLTLLTEEMRAAPVVAIQAWVNVGSADESEDIAGIAHVHEHMLFKGTAKRGSGEIARTVEAAGGEINAWTSYDQTVYHVVLAASEAATGLDILSDAIRRSAFDAAELSREIEVIVEEIRRSEDTPARRIAKALFALTYEAHPYRRPVIGSEGTVRALTRERILEFFQRHYRPDNVTVVVTGDFETAAMIELVRSYFGDWQRRPAPALPPRPREQPQEHVRVAILEEAVKEGRISAAWHVPALAHRDVAAIDVLSVLLGHGDSSRLYIETRRNREVVNDVYAYAYTPRDPGLFIIGAGLPPQNGNAALASMLEQVYALRNELVPDDELEKAKVIVMSESAYQRETVQGEARKLGFFEVVAGDYAFEQAYLEQLEAVTAEDIRAAARKYLTGAPAVVVQQPPDTAGALTREAVTSAVERAWAAAEQRQRRTSVGRGGVTRVELDNGAVLLIRPEDSPVVAVRAVGLGGLLWESQETNGIGNFLSSVWGLATESWGTDELAKRVALLGGHLASFSGRNSIGLRAEFIRERAVDGLALFSEALLAPVLHEADVERERAVTLERIRSREDNPAGYAFDLFAAALFPGHPYGFRVTGTEESVKRLTRADLLAHQRRMTSPDKLVLSVVGGITVDRAVDVLARELERASTSEPLATPPAMGERLGERHSRVRLDKKQSHLVIGGRGVTVTDDDRYPLEVMTTVLSGQSGRLFMDLRDRQSLAYSVSSSNTEGLQRGHVLVHIGTSPDKVEQALSGLYGHLARLREEPVAEAELARAVRYLVGTHAIELQRAGARATTMALNERFGLGYAHHEEYAPRIRAVTAAAVQRVAERYLNPERLVEVIVGP